MPALQLVAIRQFLGGGVIIFHFLFKKRLNKRQTMEYHHYTEYSKLCSEQCIKYWGVYISSGLGAIIGACVPLWIVIISFSRRALV
jgi:hypothetical protein